jgi:ribosomal protein S18 acetylase RimI-like enzyme
MEIRRAVVDDARGIAQVHVKSWQAAYRDLLPQSYLDALSVEQREAFWEKAIPGGAVEVLLAEVDGIIAGWVACAAARDEDVPPLTGEMQAIYLLPEYWSLGIGRALWSEAKRRLQDRGFAYAYVWVFADNARAVDFYRAAGFALNPACEDFDEYAGTRLKAVRYEMSLV